MTTGPRTALVVVSHSAQLASGVVEVAAQMAPDVLFRPAGGTDDGGIGTSYDLVEQAVTAVLGEGASGVVLLTDLGSATLTADAVLETLDDPRARVVDAPLVEGAVAAAVAAQGGADLDGVTAAARTALAPSGPAAGPVPEVVEPDVGPVVNRTLTLRNPLGLHARPAALVARMAADRDAVVRLNGVDAASVLALMALGLTAGAELSLSATGPQAQDAVDAIAAEVEAGFGEL
jgi:phosphoenolpyruvate---glycerone phosphotransferase subunit DhaM